MYSANQIHCIQGNTKIYGPIAILNAIFNKEYNNR